ncbi:MAG: TatD family hydrolase [Clostridiales bacterium]|nr:TatD family hydrolase [Candidatus Apopatousia equi]
MIIDTHAHLNDEVYDDLDRIIGEMEADNLEKIVCASADFSGSKKAVEIANNNDKIYAMIGLHPENAFEYNDEVEKFLIKESENKKVVAIGEIGLDYHYENFDKELQQKVFLKQLEIAYKVKLPVVIHVRDAYEDILNIMKSHKELLKYGGVIHCFSGSVEVAREFIELGFKIAFGGVLTFKNAKKAVEVAEKIDIKHFVVETDCPWLCPEPFRGQRNEPKNTNFVVQKLADIKHMQKCFVEKILLYNTYELFGKLER